LLLAAFMSPLLAWADTVDDFSVPQGPLTLGPGEEPTEQQATAFPDGVLGGFRIMTPVVDEDAPAGSTGTASIGGGEFECVLEFSTMNDIHGGGCAAAWADRNDRAFDFSNAEAFEFEVLEAAPGALLGIFLINGTVDPGDVIPTGEFNGVVGFIEDLTPGRKRLAIDEFINPINPFFSFDLGTVTNVLLAIAWTDGNDGTVRIGPVTTEGPIGGGPPIEPNDPVDKDKVSGTYFNPGRDGEGCQVTQEGDNETFILTCYIYQGGEQAWIIGAGTFDAGEISFNPMTLTEGADFGDDFSAEDVVRTNWGSAGMTWEDCNTATLVLAPTLPGFFPLNVIPVEKVTKFACDGPGAPASVLLNQGTMFDPSRDGEGFQIAAQGDSAVYVLTWYTYLNGEQVWLIGTGVQSGNTIAFDDLVITSGAEFGPDFDPADVVREPWGSLVLEYSDCNNARATATPLPGQTAFEAFEVDVRKLVTGVCP
jgi:hypothetical protein